MKYKTEIERLADGREEYLVKACHNDDKTSECPKCGWRDEQ